MIRTKLILVSLVLLLSAGTIARAQGRSQEPTQLEKLHDDYIKATKDLKASLEKLLPLYEKTKVMAEQKLAQSKDLFAQGLITKEEVEDSERAVTAANAKIAGVRKQMTETNTQVAQALVEMAKPEAKARLVLDYRRASARQPTCRNWTLSAYRHETKGSITVAFKFVCQK